MFKGKPKPKDGPAPGPTATALLDVRKRRDGFVMHDVAVPGSLAAPYVVASAIAAGELQPNAFPSGPQWNGLLQVCLVAHLISIFLFIAFGFLKDFLTSFADPGNQNATKRCNFPNMHCKCLDR